MSRLPDLTLWLALAACLGFYGLGRIHGQAAAYERAERAFAASSPYWKTCPEPNPVKFVNEELIKDCTFSEPCAFVSRTQFLKNVRHLAARCD